MRRLATCFFLISVAFLTGCSTLKKPTPPPAPATPPPKTKAAAHEDAAAKLAAAKGSPRITIDLGDQRAYFYKGDEMVVSSRVSSGKPKFRTPKGSFSITGKEVSHRSTTYGKHVSAEGEVINGDVDSRKDPVPEGAKFVGASMPYFMRFNGAVGMHAGRVPNYPASHGCVRLPRSMAKLFYAHAPIGTPVTVTD